MLIAILITIAPLRVTPSWARMSGSRPGRSAIAFPTDRDGRDLIQARTDAVFDFDHRELGRRESSSRTTFHTSSSALVCW